MLDRIYAVSWSSYAQPEWNEPNAVAEALVKVMRADSEARSCLLNAVGNNHAGTYYPVLLAVMPFLEELIYKGEASSQCIAMCVLDDLLASFHAEPGHEEFELADGSKQNVEAAFKQRMRALGPTLAQLASADSPNSSLARQIGDLLSEGTT